MNNQIPPQLFILSIIAKNRDGISINDIVKILRVMNRNGKCTYYTFGKSIDIGIPNEILQDINMLKLLGLIEERDGRYIATQKGYNLLTKVKSI